MEQRVIGRVGPAVPAALPAPARQRARAGHRGHSVARGLHLEGDGRDRAIVVDDPIDRLRAGPGQAAARQQFQVGGRADVRRMLAAPVGQRVARVVRVIKNQRAVEAHPVAADRPGRQVDAAGHGHRAGRPGRDVAQNNGLHPYMVAHGGVAEVDLVAGQDDGGVQGRPNAQVGDIEAILNRISGSDQGALQIAARHRPAILIQHAGLSGRDRAGVHIQVGSAVDSLLRAAIGAQGQGIGPGRIAKPIYRARRRLGHPDDAGRIQRVTPWQGRPHPQPVRRTLGRQGKQPERGGGGIRHPQRGEWKQQICIRRRGRLGEAEVKPRPVDDRPLRSGPVEERPVIGPAHPHQAVGLHGQGDRPVRGVWVVSARCARARAGQIHEQVAVAIPVRALPGQAQRARVPAREQRLRHAQRRALRQAAAHPQVRPEQRASAVHPPAIDAFRVI